jgi:hypothetical protein
MGMKLWHSLDDKQWPPSLADDPLTYSAVPKLSEILRTNGYRYQVVAEH